MSKTISATETGNLRWWKDAVIYEVYIRSFADGNNDGIGDLQGVASRVPYLASLGVDAIWLTPFYPSPQADNGYDIENYYDVDPQYGSLKDFDHLLAQAHHYNIKVMIDIVANHTSARHPWFQAALAAAPGSPERDRYLFMDGKGPNYNLPPNNWDSWFGGVAWKRVPNDRQWYLHAFSDQQPDLNWHNPEVRQEFARILTFWLDRGVDGLRVDAGMCFLKRADYSDEHESDLDDPLSHQPGVPEIFQEWREIVDRYPNRCLIGEIFGAPEDALQYVGPKALDQVFTFDYQLTYWQASKIKPVIRQWIQKAAMVDSEPVWVTSSHDQVRYVSRLGLSIPGAMPRGIDAINEQPNVRLGTQRARAMICMTAFLPGAMCIYYGEELGLPEHTTLDDALRQDPRYMPGRYIGRDGARIPMPWTAGRAPYGFSEKAKPWLPQPTAYKHLAVERQSNDPVSMLSLYRELLALRRKHGLGRGKLQWIVPPRNDVMLLKNGDLVMAINFGQTPVTLPFTGEVIAKSQPKLSFKQGRLPAGSAVWIKIA